MFEWISQNIGTIVAALLVAAAAAGAVILLVREKKKGKHSCGCGCANCPMAGKCHQNKAT